MAVMHRVILIVGLWGLYGAESTAYGQTTTSTPAESSTVPEAEKTPPPSESPDEPPATPSPAEPQDADEPKAEPPPPVESDPPATEVPPPATESEAPAASETPDQNDEVETIRVTGSRIRRTNFEGPSPVRTLNRAELDAMGFSSVADIVRTLSINTGSEFNADAFTQAGSAGTAQLNLRGLGMSSTLVLINGRRQTLSATRTDDGQSFVDINTIPVTAIERIEILTDGASALYGSDAVAGVVNIITRQDFNGMQATARYQNTAGGDQQEYQVSPMFGLQGDAGKIFVALTYTRREPLILTERPFARDAGTQISIAGQPGTFLPLGQLPDGSIGPVGVIADPNCNQAAGSALNEATGFCTFDFGPFFNLILKEDRVNAMATAEAQLGEAVTAFAEIGFTQSRLERPVSPSFANLLTPIVPANHIDNNLGPNGEGLTAVFVGRPLGTEAGAAINKVRNDTWRTVGGLRSNLGDVAAALEGWEWEASVGYSFNNYMQELQDTLVNEFNTALNSCSDPNDLSGCYSPFFDNSPGTNSPELIDRIIATVLVNYEASLLTAETSVSGPIVELPGGDLSIALGTQLRRESLLYRVSEEYSQLALSFIVGGAPFNENRNIGSFFGEIVVPAVKGAELQLAARYENYQGTGDSVNPKVGLTLEPFTWGSKDMPATLRRLRLRASFGTAFRAPTLLQTNGTFTTLEEFNFGGSPLFRSVVTRGSEDLEPEESRSWSVGMTWEALPRLNLTFDWWSYSYDGIIVRENAQQIVANDTDGTDPRIIRDATGAPARVQVSFINASESNTNGFDISGRYSFNLEQLGADDVDIGVFALRADASFVNSYDFLLGDGQETIQAAGNRNFTNPLRSVPQLRANFGLEWLYEGHYASLNLRHITGYDDDENEAQVDAWTTLDLAYSYTLNRIIGERTTFQLGIQNVLDADPPFVQTTGAFDSKVHDPRGRIFFIELTQAF